MSSVRQLNQTIYNQQLKPKANGQPAQPLKDGVLSREEFNSLKTSYMAESKARNIPHDEAEQAFEHFLADVLDGTFDQKASKKFLAAVERLSDHKTNPIGIEFKSIKGKQLKAPRVARLKSLRPNDTSDFPKIHKDDFSHFIRHNFRKVSGEDGLISRQDLTNVIMSPDFSMSDKVIMARILDNFSAFQNQKLEHGLDIPLPGSPLIGSSPPQEVISRADLDTFVDKIRKGAHSDEVRGVLSHSERTFAHIELMDKAGKHQPSPEVQEWGDTGKKALQYYLLNKINLTEFSIFDFKAQWVDGYSDTIKQAAEEYDLPELLVGGMAFNEVGGQLETISDRAIYDVRHMMEDMPEAIKKLIPQKIKEKITAPKEHTSFGNTSIQLANAAQELGYDPNNLTPTQREIVIESLQDSRQSIFISAKHLRTLANQDYRGVPSSEMGNQHIRMLGARYNVGGRFTTAQVEGYVKKVDGLVQQNKPVPKGLRGFRYGISILQAREHVQKALK